MSLPTITAVRARAVLAPFRKPPAAATGAMPQAPLVLVDLDTDAGVSGRTYLFAFQPAMLKPLVELLHGIAPMLEGRPLAPLDLDAMLRRRLLLIDTPGLVGLALAGLDQAAWDAAARVRGVPLVTLLGGAPRPVRAYNSCGLWIGPVDKLADEAEALAAEGGFGAVKLRLGRDAARDDLAAVRAVQQRLAGRIALMVDFNQRLTVAEAVARARMLDDEGLVWIEEPVAWTDHVGNARVAEAARTPIMTGENYLGSRDLAAALAARAMDFVMPDVQRIGGVTGWLRAAALADAAGMEMSTHLFPEVSAHLLAATPTGAWLEYMDWGDAVIADPVRVVDGHLPIADTPGNGIVWNETAIARWRVA